MDEKSITITADMATSMSSASTFGKEIGSKNDPTAIVVSNNDTATNNSASIKVPGVQSTKSNGKFQSQSNSNSTNTSNTTHQFRAPENSIIRSYRRTGGCHTVSSMAGSGSGSNKKFKSWTKRQNKHNNISGSGGNGNKFCNLGNSVVGTGIQTTTANLENIQEARCSIAVGAAVKNSTVPYHNRHHHQHESGGSEGRPINGQRLMSLHKKSLSHRTNHKVISSGLCNGSNSNNVVGGGGNAGGNGLNDNSGVVGVRLKDSAILGVNNISGGLVNGNVAIHLKNHCCLRSKFFLADKRPRKDNFIPPTKFLLGGNISDPLNLNSLQNEAGDCSSNDGDSSGRTPRRSPITTPPKVEVIIPPNIHDPLHLLDPVDSVEYEKQLTSPMKKDTNFVKLGGGNLSIAKSGSCIGHSSKHRNRKNRKLKRRRFDSQSTVSGNTAVEHSTSLSGSNQEENRLLVTGDIMQLHQQQNVANDNAKVPENLKAAVFPITETGHDCNSLEIQIKAQNVTKRCKMDTKLKDTVEQNLKDEDTCVGTVEQLKDKYNVTSKILDGGTCKIDEKNLNGIEYNANGVIGGRKRKVSESHSSSSLKLKKFRLDAKDRIVSPVIPQPGTWKRPIHTVSSYNSNEVNTMINRKNTFPMKFAQDLESDLTKTRDKDCLRDVSEKKQNQTIGECVLEENRESEKSMPDVSRLREDIIVNKLEEKPENKTVYNVPLSFNKKGSQYSYGNYNRHADVRHVNESMDVRLQVFHRFPELFINKDVLDIGCNVGYMTMCIAKRFAPKSILGIDIDKKLIDQARRNLSLCVRIPELNAEGNDKSEKLTMNQCDRRNKNVSNERSLSATTAKNKINNRSIQPSELFPISFPISLRPIIDDVEESENLGNPVVVTPNNSRRNTIKSCGSTQKEHKNTFPRNVSFRRCNYVLKDESYLAHDIQQYDLIVCLSVTKWIHLNFGDAGLKMAFKRMFNQLRPGGKLILEAQNWTSYKKKKKLNETIYHNFNNIEFFPKKFREYLLSSEVGFSHSYTLGVPKHMNKGFCRPIQLYAKGDYTPNHVRWSDAYYPQTPFEAYRGIYATQPPSQRGGGGSGVGGGRSSHVTSIRSLNFETPHYMGINGGGNMSGPYSSQQTPLYQANTSQYYNPLETDSYLPSYDMDYLNSMYVFASPLYQTIWSPPACMRNGSACQTPLFGSSGHDPDWTADSSDRRRHVYLPNEENVCSSPTVNPMSAFNSIRETDAEIDEGSGAGSGNSDPMITSTTINLPQQGKHHVYPPNYGEQSPCSTALTATSFATENVIGENIYQEDDVRISYNRSYSDQEVGDIINSDHQTSTNN